MAVNTGRLLRIFCWGLATVVGPAALAAPQSSLDLQTKVDQLQTSLVQTQSELSQSREQILELRRELDAIKAQLAPAAHVPAEKDNAGNYPTLNDVQSAQQTESANVEQQELSARVAEQAQTKVESGSRYKVRLSGMILMNTYSNLGRVDVSDMPSLAFNRIPNQAHGDFGMTLRQTQIGLQVTGPRLLGAVTSGDVQADFFGGFPTVNYGVTAGLLRLRTAHLQMDWTHTKVVAAQDVPFISPLSPTSYATMGEPALSWAGNLWVWTPQIRVEHRWSLSETSGFTVEGGVLDALTEQIPPNQFNRTPTPGEQSKWPVFAGRVAWGGKLFGREAGIGIGGLYGQQVYGFGRNIDSWAGTADWTFPIGQYLTLTGEFYRGQALGGLGGGVWNSVLYSGSTTSPTSQIIGLNDIGGWSQLKLQPTAKWEFNVAAGTSNPLASNLRVFPSPTGAYFPPFARNQVIFVNSILRPRSNLLLALEYRKLRSYFLNNTKQSAEQVNLAVGVAF